MQGTCLGTVAVVLRPPQRRAEHQEDAVGVRLRDVLGVDNLMWRSHYLPSESTYPQSRKIVAEILAGVPDEEQAKIAGGNTARVYRFDAPKPGAGRRP